MTQTETASRLSILDEPTITLTRLAAIIAGSDESDVRDAFAASVNQVPVEWIEELVIQSYLFSGFPRALNAAREWRRVAPQPAPLTDEGDDVTHVDEWRQHGEATCAAVYGSMYEKLRVNVRQLHPALDAAMVVEGYGKILSRPGLDLQRRELCIVAACAITRQDRQLHSHLHGALNVGVSPDVLASAIDALLPLLGPERTRSVRLLLARVVGK
ncbi:MAG: carboxymuconolactone decarboxylase family protein [bacterium]